MCEIWESKGTLVLRGFVRELRNRAVGNGREVWGILVK